MHECARTQHKFVLNNLGVAFLLEISNDNIATDPAICDPQLHVIELSLVESQFEQVLCAVQPLLVDLSAVVRWCGGAVPFLFSLSCSSLHPSIGSYLYQSVFFLSLSLSLSLFLPPTFAYVTLTIIKLSRISILQL